MPDPNHLPDLPHLADWRETRDSLRACARVLGAIRGASIPSHPRWWHVSLQPNGRGLTTGELRDPIRPVRIDLDLTAHEVLLLAEGEARSRHPIGGGTATELGERLVAELEPLGVEVSPPGEKWRDDEHHPYDPDAATRYREALGAVANAFAAVRDPLSGETSPIQLWPHHFDLSFEWFSDKRVGHEEDGAKQESPAQVGFGFSTGDDGHEGAYFYANPWPFDEAFVTQALPGEASWHTAGWSGSLLPYASIGSAEALRSYLRRVFEIAAPTLSSSWAPPDP